MEDDAVALVPRLALKTRFSEMGWGSTPPSSAKIVCLDSSGVERLVYTERVRGSKPCPGTKYCQDSSVGRAPD
jgi:hypothetical protein